MPIALDSISSSGRSCSQSICKNSLAEFIDLTHCLLWIKRPVAIGRRNVPALVQRPKVVGEVVIIQIEFALDDRPSRWINVGNAVYRHSVGTVTAVLRKIFLRV